MQAKALKAQLAARFRQLTDARGLNGVELERTTTYHRNNVYWLRKGSRLPPRHVIAAYDKVLGTGTELQDLADRIRAAEQATRLRDLSEVAGRGSAPAGAPSTVEADEEVSPTDRRTLIGGGIFAAAATAAQISDRIAGAAVPPRTLREIKKDVEGVAAAYTSTPATLLIPRVEQGWLRTERLLDDRVTGKTRTSLDTLAGQFAIYLALTADDLGAKDIADTYLDLAGQHAAEAGDRLLANCVVILESSFAHFRGDSYHAEQVAAAARPDAHPYARPMLAVCEARAAAKAGETSAARRAIDDIWANLWAGPTLPGTVPVGEDLAVVQTAAILSQLGDPASEEHARRAIETYEATGQVGHLGGAYNALARSFLRRPTPDPEQAANAARDALAAVGDQRTSWVVNIAGQMWEQMDARWPSLKPVQELGELVDPATRRALPPFDV